MPEWFAQLDTTLFFFINRGLQNRIFDIVMPFVTTKAALLFLPFLLVFLGRERKKALPVLAVALCSLLLADGLGHVLKDLAERQRPCAVLSDVHLLVGCGRSFSMPSNHASNAFAVAVPFLVMTAGRLRFLFLFGALLVGLSRVSVGVHYPSDVIVGAFVGSLAALSVTYLYRWAERRFAEQPATTVLVIFLLAVSLARVFYILFGPLDLSPDEAHYWEWSRRLDLSYYSKGPMIAYLIALGTSLFGNTELGVRSLAVVFSLLTSILLYRLGRNLCDGTVGVSTAILFQIIPLFSVFGVVFTIDSPFVFFWVLSLYSFWKAINGNTINAELQDERGSLSRLTYWFILGISVGFGLLTKYTMAFFYLCGFLFLLSSPRMRKTLKTPYPYIAAITGVAVFSPVIIWNAGHDWVTLRHTAGQAHLKDGFVLSLRSFGEFIASQFGVLTPLLLPMLLIALWKVRRRDAFCQPDGANASGITPPEFASEKKRGCKTEVKEEKLLQGHFLFWFSVPILLFFTLKSLQGKVQANWAMAGYVTAIIAFSAVSLPRWKQQGRVLKGALTAAVLLAFITTAVSHFSSGLPIPARLDPSSRLKGWRDLGAEVTSVYREMQNHGDVFIFSDRYQVASELAFYVEGNPATYCVNLGRRMNQYDLWPGFGRFIHQNGIFVTIGDKTLAPSLAAAFARCEKRLFRVSEGKQVLRDYSIFRCSDFRGMDQEKARSY